MLAMQDSPLSKKELRNFALVTSAMLILFFGMLLPWLWDVAFPLWPWVTAIILALWGLLLPASLAPVYHLWMKFAHVLGWINTRLILSIIFFLIFLPFGLIMRLLGNDPMARRFDAKINTYRVKSAPCPHENMEKPF